MVGLPVFSNILVYLSKYPAQTHLVLEDIVNVFPHLSLETYQLLPSQQQTAILSPKSNQRKGFLFF